MGKSGYVTKQDENLLRPFAEMYEVVRRRLESLTDDELRLLVRSSSKQAVINWKTSFTLCMASSHLRSEIQAILRDREELKCDR